MRIWTSGLAVAVTALAPGCAPAPDAGDEGEGEGGGCFIGDRDADPEVHVVTFDADTASFVDVDDGGDIAIAAHPLGDYVVYVGVRGRNLPCSVTVNAALREDVCDADAGIFVLESRNVTLVDDGDGNAIPAPEEELPLVQSFANLVACPSLRTVRDVDDERYELEVSVSVGDAALAHAVLHVVPRCADAACTCACDAGFNGGIAPEDQCPTIDDDDPAPATCP